MKIYQTISLGMLAWLVLGAAAWAAESATNQTASPGDETGFAPGRYGNLFDEARRSRILAAPDSEVVKKTVKPTDWSDYEVRAEGARVIHSINGVTLLEYIEPDDSIPREGLIALHTAKTICDNRRSGRIGHRVAWCGKLQYPQGLVSAKA